MFSNPISPPEAGAAARALEILDSDTGSTLMEHLRKMTSRFRDGLEGLGFEYLENGHPIVPLMVRDSTRLGELSRHLRAGGILVTGLHFPVVPHGDEEIRFQVSADHTAEDIDEALGILATFAT